MRSKNLSSIFETSLSHKIHTVTFDEALSRITKICGYRLSNELGEKLIELQNLRNQITHSEIYFDEYKVNNLFESFLDMLESFFYKAIGNEYRTLTGYSMLIKHYDVYKEFLRKKNMDKQVKVLECFVNIFKETNIGMGLKEVKLFSDINIVEKLLKRVLKSGLRLGLDLYNGYSSGHVSRIKKKDKNHLSFFTEDNQSEYIFKFKGMLAYMPSLSEEATPFFYFESEDDVFNDDLNDRIDDCYNIKYTKGIYFEDNNEVIYEEEKMNEFYDRVHSDEEYDIPKHYRTYRFLTRGIFCYMNIQPISNNVSLHTMQKFSLKQLEVGFRKTLERRE